MFTLFDWLGCRYPLQLPACHDHATLCNSCFRKIFFDLDTGFGAYPYPEKPRLVPPSSGSKGKYRQKKVKDLVLENFKGNWEVSKPFFFYSRAHSFSVLHVFWSSFNFLYERQHKFAYIELQVSQVW